MRYQVIFFCFCFCVYTGVMAGNGITSPKIKWSFKTEGSIRGSSVISNGKIFFGSADGFLYALNEKDGSLLWKCKTGGAISGSPSVAGSSVYISSRDHYVYSVNANTGTLNWRFKMLPIVSIAFDQWDYFMAAPVVAGNRVLAGSGDGYLYSLDTTNGKVQWKFKTNGRIRATALVDKDIIYQPSNDGYVYAISLNTGKLNWKFETKGASYHSADFGFDRNCIYTKPLINNNLLIFGSRDGNTYAVDLTSHREKWSFNYGTTWAMGTAVSADMVFVEWSTNNLVCAVDLNNGKEKWKFETGAHNYTTPLLIDSGVYIGSADGKVYKLNKYSGEKVWDYCIGSEVHSSLQYDSACIYFGSDNGFFYALEDGEKPYKEVYEPAKIEGNAKYFVADTTIAPFLQQRGFERLDSAALYRFLKNRIEDGKPGVIVFSLALIPGNIIGADPEKGMIRKYLDAGGKIIWMGNSPNYFEPDSNGNFKKQINKGNQLLGVQFINPDESGNFYSKTTQEGLNTGLPQWLTITSSPVAGKGVVPLAYDEYGRVSAWTKKFNPRAGSGFICFRSFSYNVPAKKEDLELIEKLALYGLE